MKQNNLVKNELEYFKPMLIRQKKYSLNDRLKWKNETIRERQERVNIEICNLLDWTIKYGPFKGIKIEKDKWWGNLDSASQCLGLYELEILNYLKKYKFDKNKKFDTFIDIGAADGYYAIGMLYSGLTSQSVCFEISPKGREVIQKNWENNGSKGKLKIYGKATPKKILNLSDTLFENTLILIDIEGNEFDLLDKDVLYKIKNCIIIIEIHNWINDFNLKYEKFLNMAYKNFDISVFKHAQRNINKFSFLRDFTDDNRYLAISERRPCLMRFIKLTPKIKN